MPFNLDVAKRFDDSGITKATSAISMPPGLLCSTVALVF
jgi:hypothetical protein